MQEKIGQIIKRVVTSQGLSQRQFGEKINRTKQAVANIYKRTTIDIEGLLKERDYRDKYYSLLEEHNKLIKEQYLKGN